MQMESGEGSLRVICEVFNIELFKNSNFRQLNIVTDILILNNSKSAWDLCFQFCIACEIYIFYLSF